MNAVFHDIEAAVPTDEDTPDNHRNAPRPSPACLYGLIGEIARAGAETTEANPYAIAANAMAYMSCAVGRAPYMPIGNTWHHARLFTQHVGRSGEGRKGDSVSLVKRIAYLVREMDGTLSPQIHAGGLSSREGLVFLIHDGYHEGKEEVPAIDDKRLWVIESEFVNILHQGKRDGNTLSAALRDCWDGVSLKPATKTNRLWASDPHVCLSVAITPSELMAMTSEQIKEALSTIGQRAAVIGEFRDALKTLPFENLKAMSYDTAELLIAAAGGLDALNTGLTGYFENYYSDAERTAVQTDAVRKALADLGLTMPDLSSGSEAARAQFRALVEAQDISTEKGRENYVALLSLQGAFAGLTPAIDTTSDALRQAEEAARAAQAALTERTRLEDQLLQVQGNTAALRERELARLLNDENRAIQTQIWAEQRAQDAAQAAIRAAQEAASQHAAMAEAAESAAREMRDAWASVADSVLDEVKRLRGEVAGTGQMGLAYAQSQLAINTAKARAGDQDAYASLPELSRTVSELAKQNAGSALELQLLQSQIAASLEETTKIAGRRQGFAVPAFESGGTHSGGWALVGEKGPELAHLPPARIYNAGQTTDMLGNGLVVAELKALREENRTQAGEIVRLNLRVSRVLEKWDVDGQPAERSEA